MRASHTTPNQALYRLRIPEWPHAGPVAILERDFARTRAELHVARDWCYVGSAREPSKYRLLDPTAPLPTFDIDVFRLLQRCLQDRSATGSSTQRLSRDPKEWYD